MKGLVVAAIASGALAFAAPASASTFCVPDYFEGCTAQQGQALSTVQLGLITNGNDGNPDTVRIAPGTYSQATTFTASGSDDLTVIGSGRDKTDLTSTSSSPNVYVVNLFSGNTRNITFRDLSITAPASFPTDSGSTMIQLNDTFERVDFLSKNDGSNGVIGITYGGTFRDVTVKGVAGGSIGLAIGSTTTPEFCGPGENRILVEDVVVENAAAGITADCPQDVTIVDGARISGTDVAVNAGDGTKMTVRNALIKSGDGNPIKAFNNDETGDTELTVEHATVIAEADPTKPAVSAQVYDFVGNDDVRVSVHNSILSGFEKAWTLIAPSGINKGNVSLNIQTSNFPVPGTGTGDSMIGEGGNTTVAPVFVSTSDFHLAAGSPLIDAGAQIVDGPTTDLEGNARVVDGNGDGAAQPDVGAYEYQPPAPVPTCETDPSLCPEQEPKDTTKPKVSKVKFSFKVGKGGSIRMSLSEDSKVKVVLKPTPKGKRKAKAFTRNAKAGLLKIKLGKKQLKPGRYRLSIVATDAAGNRSNPVIRKVKIRQ